MIPLISIRAAVNFANASLILSFISAVFMLLTAYAFGKHFLLIHLLLSIHFLMSYALFYGCTNGENFSESKEDNSVLELEPSQTDWDEIKEVPSSNE